MSKFDIKDKFDALLYSAYNAYSSVRFFFSGETRRILKSNLKYKDIHAGEQCFILGTGPSLKKLTEAQVKFLSSEFIFGTNSSYKVDTVSLITPKYYALMDNLYWEEWSDTFSHVATRYKNDPPIFITDIRAKELTKQASSIGQHIYVHSKKFPITKMSDQLHENIFGAMNVVSFSILVAMYMGFKKIYLLGCDYNSFCAKGYGHAYDDKSEVSQSNYNLAFYLKFYHITTEFHYLIEKLARSKNIEIINITPDSLLDAYRSQSAEDVLVARAQ